MSTTNKPFLEINEYSRAIKRLENGYFTCTDIAKSIKDRATIEATYSNNLKKWAETTSNIIAKGGEYNTTRTCWLDNLSETKKLAEIHLNISQTLLAEPMKKILDWQKEHYKKPLIGNFKEVDRYDKDFRKAQKNWLKLYKSHNSAKKLYHGNCMKRKSAANNLENLDLERTQTTTDGNANKQENLKNKINKQKQVLTNVENDVISSRDNYKKAIQKCNENISEYETEMSNVYEKMQIDELNRLNKIKDLFQQLQKVLNPLQNPEYTKTFESEKINLSKISPENDIKWWHNARGMGIKMNWPVYEEYDSSSALTSLDQNLKKPNHSTVAGISNIKTKSFKASGDFKTNLTDYYEDEFADGDDVNKNPFLDEDTGVEFDKGSVSCKSVGSSTNHIPAQIPEQINNYFEPFQVIARYSYNAEDQDEISLMEGVKLMQISDIDDKGWCKGRLDSGVEGLFPASYVER